MEIMSDADNFNSYARRCGVVFAALACVTLVMVGVSAARIPSQGLKIGLVLAAAGFNAALVAGYLMHLVSERRTIYAVLAFTGVFFAGLMGLTILAWHDVPTVIHP
jgi:hypothetical protein